MALTVTSRGTNKDKTAGTSYGFSPGSNFAIDSLAVLVIACDNAGTNGANPITGVTDNGTGQGWAQRQTVNRTPGSVANDGCSCEIWTQQIGSGRLNTTDTVTVAFGAVSVAAKAYTLIEVTAGGGTYARYLTGNTTSGSGTAFTMTTASIANTDAVICGLALEDNSSGADDADTTNGNWSTGQASNTTTGGAATNIGTRSQAKVVTATGAQTWNFTVTNTDWAAAWIEVYEAPAARVVVPTGASQRAGGW